MTLEENFEAIVRRVLREELATLGKPAETTSDGYLTINESAAIVGVHHTTIRGWISDSSLKAVKAGRSWRILRADLDRRLQTGGGNNKATEDIDRQVDRMLARSR